MNKKIFASSFLWGIGTALGLSVLIGCTSAKDTPGAVPYGESAPSSPQTPTTPPPVATVPEQSLPAVGGQPSAPTAGPMQGGPMSGSPMAPLTPTPELDKAIQDALGKKDKKIIAAAYASRGFSRMTDDNAGARVKYRKALEDFRVALANDPTNQKALDNKKQIENIYTSMGRPIPGEETAPTKK